MLGEKTIPGNSFTLALVIIHLPPQEYSRIRDLIHWGAYFTLGVGWGPCLGDWGLSPYSKVHGT